MLPLPSPSPLLQLPPAVWHLLVLWPLCMRCLAVLLQQLSQLLWLNCIPQPVADAAAQAALLHLHSSHTAVHNSLSTQ
jgi:hypothetical protein